LSDETKLKISNSLRETSSTKPAMKQTKSSRDAFIKTMIRKMMEADFDSLPHQSKRKRIIIEQEGKCSHCGLSEWRGEPICFEMDHIDGDNTNNHRSNLEILCPNCHSNTPTWKGRKNSRDNSRIEEYIKARKEMVRVEGIEPSRLP
jgi:5-methylcytosine-specific restriction endonuclease McrA